jgi:4-diphosphocytidyl-2-C-methyl-D-erythritol kinase
LTLAAATLQAPAKVNLFLRVLSRRSDGYHDIETVFQLIAISDTVRVALDPSLEGVTLSVRGPDLGPEDENLAYRAAVAFREAFGVDDGVDIELTKTIPAGGGLGGGSSDAGAVLLLLRDLTGRGDRLRELAADLGSDVPFFVSGSARARAIGRGEVLTPLEPLPEMPIVVAMPPVHVSTAWAYGQVSARLARATDSEQGIVGSNGSERMLAPPGDWTTVAEAATNDFQALVAEAHPEVARSLDALRDRGAALSLLSGSGAACFGLFDTEARARSVAKELTATLGWPFAASRTLSAPPESSAERAPDRVR